MEAFKGFCQKYRREPDTNRNRFAILQAEDEIAAIGMVIGASWAGARAFTPTAGPGISLMNEFIGLAYYAEVPAVIFDVQRTGPSTGMPTRTQQGDLMMCAYASHGDTRHICLYPADPREAFEFAVAVLRSGRALPDAGVRAERPRHRHERLDGAEADLGRQLSSRSRQGAQRRRSSTRSRRSTATSTPTATASPPARCPACIPRAPTSRADPATTASARYTEDGDEYVEVIDRIDRKIQRAARAVPAAARSSSRPGATIGLVTVGGCHAACIEALDLLAADGIAIDYMRVRGFPFGDEVGAFLDRHDVNFIVEQNRDGQLRNLLMLETGCRSRSWSRCATTAASR